MKNEQRVNDVGYIKWSNENHRVEKKEHIKKETLPKFNEDYAPQVH
jgi:hypothetical protein